MVVNEKQYINPTRIKKNTNTIIYYTIFFQNDKYSDKQFNLYVLVRIHLRLCLNIKLVNYIEEGFYPALLDSCK